MAMQICRYVVRFSVGSAVTVVEKMEMCLCAGKLFRYRQAA